MNIKIGSNELLYHAFINLTVYFYDNIFNQYDCYIPALTNFLKNEYNIVFIDKMSAWADDTLVFASNEDYFLFKYF